jgi:hypothetical protein
MTFLNTPLLWGLLGIAIPILIHLLNRRKASVVEWGAMRFLLASLASRNRRILVEEVLLMAVRCLAVGLIAMAMARPLLPSGAEHWAVALAILPVAAVLGAVAAVLWARKAVRWTCLAAAAAMALVAAAALAREDLAFGQKWAGGSSAQDIAIVIDGSLSMNVRAEGQTNFERAVEDARAVLAGCRASDTVSIILGGSSPRDVVVPGVSNRKQLLDELGALRPSNGSLRIIPSLISAAGALSKGHNPGKKIVLITDGQSVGWDLPGAQAAAAAKTGPAGGPADTGAAGRSRQNEERWRWLAGNLAGPRGALPKIVCRLLPPLPAFHNLCVDEVTFSRNVVGVDRPVRIDVKVSNTGVAQSAAAGVELFVDGASVAKGALDEVPPNASQAIHFEYQFASPGAKTIEARLDLADDLPGDNSAFARLNVMEELPVLIVEGSPSAQPLGGASAFVQIALAPSPRGVSRGEGILPSRPAGILPASVSSSVASSSPSSASASASSVVQDLVRTTVVDASGLAAAGDLGRYRAVILAGAPMLPEAAAKELAAYVQRGGGLLILPGDLHAVTEGTPTHFYDTWTSPTGKPVSPARLARRIVAQGQDQEPAVHPAPQTFAHPALEVLADPVRNYAASVLIRSYWELQSDEKDTDVRVAGRLDTGQPFLVERRLGDGRVLLLCTSLDYRQSNLPAVRPFFVPLVHEMVYYLCGAVASYGNLDSGQEASFAVPSWLSDLAVGPGRGMDILTPQGLRRPAQIADIEGIRRLVFSDTDAPGVYRALPPTGQKTGPAAASAGTFAPARKDDLFFVVRNQPGESRLDRLAPSDILKAGKQVPIATAGTTEELAAFVHGGTPGMEIWQGLAIFAALLLLAEIALTRWIARRRKLHAALPVTFGKEPLDIQSFRAHAREMLAASGAGGTGKGNASLGGDPKGSTKRTGSPSGMTGARTAGRGAKK